MLTNFLKKEWKVFFSRKSNLAFLFLLPMVLVLIFGLCLENYMDASFSTFQDITLFYYTDEPGADVIEQFQKISQKIQEATGVALEETEDYEVAVERVERSEGVAVIMLKESGLFYYHSPYNETNDGKIIRSLYEQFCSSEIFSDEYVSTTVMEINKVNSKVYYSFAALSFSILYMALLIANTAADERQFMTIDRIRLSGAGIGRMIAGKIITGVVCGGIMTAVVAVLARIFFGISWGDKAYVMTGMFLLLALFSASAGCTLGLICRNKVTCQNIILILNVLFGFLGGSFLPVSMLERMPVLWAVIRISPLYWLNKAMAALYNGKIDHYTAYSAAVLAAACAGIILLYRIWFQRRAKV